jgi:hypothetical protein
MPADNTKKRQYDPTERLGVIAADTFFTNIGWIFRPQTAHDVGIDAQVEATDKGKLTGLIVAVQIKSGVSYFRGTENRISLYVKNWHAVYWNQIVLPVIVVLHNPKTGETLWQWAKRPFIKQVGKRWRIDIPRTNLLDDQAGKLFVKTAKEHRWRVTNSAGPRFKTADLSATFLRVVRSYDHYLQRFTYAVRLIRAIPFTAEKEIRNAFDALIKSLRAQLQRQSSRQNATVRTSVILEAERCRRHILIAGYNSVLYALVARSRAIAGLIEKLERKIGTTLDAERSRFERAYRAYDRLPKISEERAATVRQVIADNKEIEKLTIKWDLLLDDLDRLYLHLAKLGRRRGVIKN